MERVRRSWRMTCMRQPFARRKRWGNWRGRGYNQAVGYFSVCWFIDFIGTDLSYGGYRQAQHQIPAQVAGIEIEYPPAIRASTRPLHSARGITDIQSRHKSAPRE